MQTRTAIGLSPSTSGCSSREAENTDWKRSRGPHVNRNVIYNLQSRKHPRVRGWMGGRRQRDISRKNGRYSAARKKGLGESCHWPQHGWASRALS